MRKLYNSLLATTAPMAFAAPDGKGGGGGTTEVEVGTGGSTGGSITMDTEGGDPTITRENNDATSVEPGEKSEEAPLDEGQREPDDDEADADAEKPEGDTEAVELPEWNAGEDGTVDPAVVEAYDKVYRGEGGKLDMQALSTEWWGNAQANEDGKGHLSEGAYAYLDHLGIPRDMVVAAEAGQLALNNERDGKLFARAGGKPNFDAAFQWAVGGGYTPEQKAAFNRAIAGDDSVRADAVDLMMSRFDAANTSKANPKRSAADEAGAGAGEGGKGANGQTFGSKEEWLAARKEAGRDMAKQAEVSRKFRRSPGAKNW